MPPNEKGDFGTEQSNQKENGSKYSRDSQVIVTCLPHPYHNQQ